MIKRLGCFHAHHSNIAVIDSALTDLEVELIHFVDPGLDRIKNDPHTTVGVVQSRINATLDWIASVHVDAILITCTFFTAHLDDQWAYSVPIIKIDEPLFQWISNNHHSHLLLFTNPSTVDGTIKGLENYAKEHQQTIDIQPYLIPNAFELLMDGKKSDYERTIFNAMQELIKNYPNKVISTAQLSMSSVAESHTERQIMNHYKLLAPYIKTVLSHL